MNEEAVKRDLVGSPFLRYKNQLLELCSKLVWQLCQNDVSLSPPFALRVLDNDVLYNTNSYF